MNTSCFKKYNFNQSLDEANQNDSLCGVVYFSNLAHPQWYLTSCNKSYTAHVLCHYSYESLDHPGGVPLQWTLESVEYKKFLHHIASTVVNKDPLCPGDSLLSDDNCLKFIRHEYSFTALNYATRKQGLERSTWNLLQCFSKVNSLRPVFVFQKSKLIYI